MFQAVQMCQLHMVQTCERGQVSGLYKLFPYTTVVMLSFYLHLFAPVFVKIFQLYCSSTWSG